MKQDQFVFEQVPPPDKAPEQSEAKKLGLVTGLRAERSRNRPWRCGNCSTMQPGGSTQVWVPDSVRRGDPEWSVTEACRQNAWNGHHTAWCLKCAPKAKKKPKEVSDASSDTSARGKSLWSGIKRLIGVSNG